MKRTILNEKANLSEIKRGTRIVGKWNQERYDVLREIGSGMIGTVYLCRNKGKFVALKISTQSLSMTTEVNVLKALNKVQANRVGPYLLDVDDWLDARGRIASFYVMEYIKGVSLESYVNKHGPEWIGPFLLQMLEQLDILHERGWIFGDLKNDNVLVTSKPPTVRFIDVGGTTKIGRAVKEYSELYDRGYWNLGSRIAEPSYDLFSLVIVMLYIFYPNQLQKTAHSRRLLCQKIAGVKELSLYALSLQRAICGQYRTAKEMKSDILYEIVSKKGSQLNKAKRHSVSKAELFLLMGLTGVYGVFVYLLS